MPNFNKIYLMGNITRDPQLSYLPSNTAVVELGMAVNRRFRRQDGEQGEETLFVDCRAFGRTAEVLNQYTAKGKPLFIEGRLQLDKWTDREGNPRSKHRVFIENFQFIDGDGKGDTPEPPPPQQSQRPNSVPGAGPKRPAPQPNNDPDGDDIPF